MTDTAHSREDDKRVVHVFVRPTALTDPIDRKIRRIRRLADRGVVDDVLVWTWPAEVRLSSEEVETRVVETYERITTWAEREGASVEPAFDRKECHSKFTGETCELLVTPMMGLAVYEGDVLRAAFPHADANGHHSVTDAIDVLEAGGFQPTSGTGSTVEGRCPSCGAAIVDVQGLLTCRTCDWVAKRIDALRSVRGDPGAREGSVTGVDSCPECETYLVSVQGILICPECKPVGAVRVDRQS